MRMQDIKRCWQCVLLLAIAVAMAACTGEEDGLVGTPPVGGEQPQPWIPAPAPVPVPVPEPAPVVDTGPWVLDLERGAALFVEKCQRCHGPSGVGAYGPPLTNTTTCPPCRDFTALWRRIDEYMPFRNPEACDADCSRHLAAWISNSFSTAPSCSVDFRYTSLDAQHFSATVRIFNFRGLEIPSWRLGFTLPPGHAVTGASNALVVQTGDQVLVTPPDGNTGISDGAILEIGLQGTHGGLASIPNDLRLEASPCFAAPPASST